MAPKRPAAPFILFLNHIRAQIKKQNPGISVTAVARIGGERWRALDDSNRGFWLEQAAILREEYERALQEYDE